MIGRDRTRSPFDVVDAFNGLLRHDRPARHRAAVTSLTTLADTFRGTRRRSAALLGRPVPALHDHFSRDAELKRPLANTRQLSTRWPSGRGDVVKLINDGNLLLGELQRRKEAIANCWCRGAISSPCSCAACRRQPGAAAARPET
ncbi:hypothetical protein HBB16_06970 [Pseudonocardia sp. MCCB 268]|nr:hypothetical protein [Pseudonocardia cytotoxica]